MKKSTKIIALILAFVLAMSATAAVTVALLTDEEKDVNVMTLGNVYIEQYEQERDDSGNLKEFTQNQLWLPVTDKAPAANESILGYPAYANKIGVMDKIVTVKNTGTVDAYVRTVIAYECPEGFDPTLLHINDNSALLVSEFYATIDGVKHLIREYVYAQPLSAGDVTEPSLLQAWLDYDATNDDVNLYEGKMEIVVLSQAVQAAGFDTAAIALDTAFGKVDAINVAKWFAGAESVEVSGTNKAALLNAINAAQPGDVIVLTENTTIAGYDANNKLVIEKPIILDLNGKTLTTESGWGGIDLKGGASIVNGTINHTGNTAAIKAFQVDVIENVTINVTETAGKTKGGIVVQEGADRYVNTIRNVTIKGATNGIECNKNSAASSIGTMTNVKIDALQNGIYLNGAGRIGKISNCEIKGGNIGINAYLANLWHIALDIENSTVTGGTTGIDIWDEAHENTGSTVTFHYDTATTTFDGSRENIKITLQEEITCTVNGTQQATPCDVRIK